jgi:hypothetical protein
MAQRHPTIWFPSEEESGVYVQWTVTADGMQAGELVQLDARGDCQELIIALPVESLVSLPVCVPGGDAVVAEGVALTEMEDLGVESPLKGNDGISHAGYVPGSSPGADPQRGWGFALTKAPPLPEGAEIRYCPSVALLPLPDEGIAIWGEGGRLVSAWTFDGHLVHCSPLTSSRLDQDLAMEILTITASLEADGHIDGASGLYLFGLDAQGGSDGEFLQAVERGLGRAPECAEALQPRLPEKALPAIVPTGLAARLVARRRAARVMTTIGSVFALLTIVLVALCAATWWRAGRLDEREAALQAGAGDVQRIRFARERWQSMAGALEPESFPIELLHQCVLLMPESGVRLTRFECGGGRLTVSGVATNARQALAYRDQFDRDGPLGVFRWTLPSPDILRDGQASFRAEGKSIYATDDY